MLSVNIINFPVITVENVDNRCMILNISKSETIKLLEYSVGIYKKIFF